MQVLKKMSWMYNKIVKLEFDATWLSLEAGSELKT